MRITGTYGGVEQRTRLSVQKEWGSSAERLALWSDALESARATIKTDEKSVWDRIFEQRAENHALAMALARERSAARQAAARLDGDAVMDAYAAASTGNTVPLPGLGVGD